MLRNKNNKASNKEFDTFYEFIVMKILYLTFITKNN